MLQNPLSQAIISSMVEIAKVMKASTVAEHVENELVRTRLKDLGVHFGQGFVIHRPEPLAKVFENLGDPIGGTVDDVEMIDLGQYVSPAAGRRSAA